MVSWGWASVFRDPGTVNGFVDHLRCLCIAAHAPRQGAWLWDDVSRWSRTGDLQALGLFRDMAVATRLASVLKARGVVA